jgi:hypothetical protein
MSRTQPAQFPHSIGLSPNNIQGVRMVPVTVSFPGVQNGLQVYTDDFQMEEMDGTINAIQSLYFDNSRNFAPMFFTVNETQQQITFPPQSQGFIPLFAQTSMSYTVQYSGQESGEQGNAVLRLYFYNTPCQPAIWYPYSTVTGLQTSSFNGTGAAFTVQTNNAGNVFPNRRIFIDGWDTGGNLPTTAIVLTASLSNTLSTAGGEIGVLDYLIEVPAAGGAAVGYFFEKKYNPPLMVGQGAAIPGGFQATNGVLQVSAVGAGQTGAVTNLYWHLA